MLRLLGVRLWYRMSILLTLCFACCSIGNSNSNTMTDDETEKAALVSKKRKKAVANLETTFHWTKKLCLSSGTRLYATIQGIGVMILSLLL